MPADVEVAAVVEVEPMTPEAGVHVADVQVVTMQVNVPAMEVGTMDVNVPAQMDMTAVTMDVTDHAGVANHAVAAMTADAVMTTTAAAMRARIGSAGRESCNADNGRRDEGEESRTFEHCRRPFWLDVGHPNIGRSTHASGSSD
jgi:hypothetical protein